MTRARFSIGIDLGTTNCALAFVPLDREARSELLAIPQWETLSSNDGIADTSVLSVPAGGSGRCPDSAVARREREWIVGRLARKKAAESPGRVVHSAKSWLCHHTSDRSARFLPWGSDDIARDQKISPVPASALILPISRSLEQPVRRCLSSSSISQDITVTVPASFDAAAQRLTLMLPQEAGFPETVRLLEEPQAAFYCWLEQHDFATDLSRASYRTRTPGRTTSWWSTLVAAPRISAYLNCARTLGALRRKSSARQWATTSCWAATMSISRSHTSSNRD